MKALLDWFWNASLSDWLVGLVVGVFIIGFLIRIIREAWENLD